MLAAFSMRARMLSFLVLVAFLWCTAGEPVLACAGENPANVQFSSNSMDQFSATDQADIEHGTSTTGQAAAYHHCCAATNTAALLFASPRKPKPMIVTPAHSAALSSFAQAPPIQPPAA